MHPLIKSVDDASRRVSKTSMKSSQTRVGNGANTVQLVKGTVTFEDDAPPFTGATMYVSVENTSVADIASEVVADYVERDVAFVPKTAKVLLFEIAAEVPDPRASYSVKVHIDIDGDGEVSLGDFISMQSYPVITGGHPTEISILVRQVK